MLTLICKIIVLLQSLRYTSQITRLYLSSYWQSTYVTDKVPDYWNHGPIYIPGLQERKKTEEIFPAWLTKTTTESSQVARTTPMEDYEIEIFKPSTDDVFSKNNAEIEKKTASLRTDVTVDTTTPMPETEVFITYSIILNTAQTSGKNDLTRPEFKTTIDDYHAHPEFTTMNPAVKTSSEEPTSNSIITDHFIKTDPLHDKNDFTHPVFETMVGDDDAHHISFTMTLPSTTSYETTFDYAAHPNSTRMTPQPSTPEYDTPDYDYDEHSESTKMTAQTSTAEYDTPDYEYDEHSESTRMTPETSTAKDDTTLYDYDSHAESTRITPPTEKLDTTYNYDAHPESTRMRQQKLTPKYDRMSYVYDSTKLTQKEASTTAVTRISTSKAFPEPVIRSVNREMATDPFSVFLRKLMIVLSVKRLEDLAVLVTQFKEYVWMLLNDGHIGKMGLEINSYIARMVMMLETIPVEVLRNIFNNFQKMLVNRAKALPKDVNDILDYMDDTYDEAEEEAMQTVLYEASAFPKIENNDTIAQGFVDFVFSDPMQRVMGTTRGDVLFDMITKAVTLREKIIADEQTRMPAYIGFRKSLNFGKIRKHLRKLSDMNSDDNIPTLNKSYERKDEDSNAKSDSSSDNLRENSDTIKSPDDIYEHSDETEGSKGAIENKYGFKNNENISRNGKQHRASTNLNRAARTRKIRKSITKLRALIYSVQTKSTKDDYVEIKGNAFPQKHPRTTTANTGNSGNSETNGSGNIEMELKAKIYDNLRRLNTVNYNASRRIRQPIQSTVDVPNDSQETDVERVLKKNIYKAVNKLLN